MNKNVVVSIVVLLAGTLACAVPAGMTPTPIVITQVIVIPNTDVPTQPPTQAPALPPAPSPEIELPTITQQSAELPTSTVTATVPAIATLSGPTATFIQNANCRAGPGTGYDVVTSYFAGQTVEIVGRNPGGKCWVSLSTAQAKGDFDAIPTVMP